MMGFVKSKKRDEDKKNWCEINSIRYVSLSFDSTETWKDTISNE
jgi:hypothetical protein